jgi:hypothetical protein
VSADAPRRAPRTRGPERNAETERFERFIAARPPDPALTLFTRRAGNGRLRHFIQVPAPHAQAFVRRFGAAQRVVGLFAARHPTTDHVYLRLGVHVYDLVLEVGEGDDRAWTVNRGGKAQRFREGSHVVTERLLQLTALEYARLERHVAALMAAVRARGGYLPRRPHDCMSTWTLARIGAGRRTLAEVVGIGVVRYVPAVMDALLDEGNERVLGTAVYPVRGREFRRFDRIRERFLPDGVTPAEASARHDGYPQG